MIKIILIGALGRMGRALMRSAFHSKDAEIVSVVESPDCEFVGKKISSAVPDSELNLQVTANMFEAMSRGDVVIDFSNPVATMECIKVAKRKELPVVIGTTGFSKPQFSEIKKYAKELPVLLSSNMSMGLNTLACLASKLTVALGDSYDVEICEMHHRNKKDAPSGTALYLASSIASAKKLGLADVLIEKREGLRDKGKIGVSVLRGGDVVGVHTVYFAGDGEIIELTHRVSDRKVFADGALEAARWLIGKEPGLYSMVDVIGIK